MKLDAILRKFLSQHLLARTAAGNVKSVVHARLFQCVDNANQVQDAFVLVHQTPNIGQPNWSCSFRTYAARTVSVRSVRRMKNVRIRHPCPTQQTTRQCSRIHGRVRKGLEQGCIGDLLGKIAVKGKHIASLEPPFQLQSTHGVVCINHRERNIESRLHFASDAHHFAHPRGHGHRRAVHRQRVQSWMRRFVGHGIVGRGSVYQRHDGLPASVLQTGTQGVQPGLQTANGTAGWADEQQTFIRHRT